MSVEDHEKKRGGQWSPQAVTVHCTRDNAPEGTFNTYTVYYIQLLEYNKKGKPELITIKNPRVHQETVTADKIDTRLICQEKTIDDEGNETFVNWVLNMAQMKVVPKRCSTDDFNAWTKVRFDVFIEKNFFSQQQTIVFIGKCDRIYRTLGYSEVPNGCRTATMGRKLRHSEEKEKKVRIYLGEVVGGRTRTRTLRCSCIAKSIKKYFRLSNIW
jgi:hypothetical protein